MKRIRTWIADQLLRLSRGLRPAAPPTPERKVAAMLHSHRDDKTRVGRKVNGALIRVRMVSGFPPAVLMVPVPDSDERIEYRRHAVVWNTVVTHEIDVAHYCAVRPWPKHGSASFTPEASHA